MIQEGIVLVAVIIIAEILKRVTEGKYNRYLPAIVLILGIIGNVFYEGMSTESIFQGILIGGAAAGVYDFGAKTVLNK